MSLARLSKSAAEHHAVLCLQAQEAVYASGKAPTLAAMARGSAAEPAEDADTSHQCLRTA